MSNILELHNLKKYYATQKAVDDISFSIKQGSIFGLLGPNGAGKTTLLRMITGIFFPDSGRIQFDGKDFDPLNDIIIQKDEDWRPGLIPCATQGPEQKRSHGKNKILV